MRDPGTVSPLSGALPTSPRHLLAVAAVVAAGYYLGAQIGLALTFPPATTSVLWPPNAILTAALLLVPPRHWWVCLAAALPVHILLEIGPGSPPGWSALLFVTNCSEALIAAHRRARAQRRPDAVRLVPPRRARSSAAPACSRRSSRRLRTPRSSTCCAASRTGTSGALRVFANVLTELSVVPAIILGWRAPVHRVSRPRRCASIEAVAFVGGADRARRAGVRRRRAVRDALPVSPPTPIVLLLPVFGWAAMRFGVGGVSAALLGCRDCRQLRDRRRPPAVCARCRRSTA